jgi:twitching motility protein PilT
MREHAIAGEYRTWVVNALRQSPLFASLEPSLVEQVIGYGRLIELDANEFIVREGDPSDSFYLLLMGEAAVLQMHPVVGQMVESGRIRPVEAIGELGLLLRQPRSRSVVANRQTFCLRFGSKAFDDFTERLPGFARLLASTLASRAQQSQSRVLLPDATAEELVEPSPELTRLLTPQVMVQHRLVPLRRAEGGVVFGLASEPTAQTIAAIRRAIPQTPFRCVRVPLEYFERVARVSSFFDAAGERPPGGGGRLQAAEAPRRPTIERRQVSMVARLDQLGTLQPLLKRMVQNTASDLHLSARQRPWWRIDGDILEIDDAKVVAPSEVYDTLEPFLPDHGIREFEEHHDVDFSFAVEGLARFRVNMFREENGVSAVLRMIPNVVPTMDQLGLPPAPQKLCELQSGLVLVTGPTGCGKSTTIASMLDHVNRSRRRHILTIEDPIEFLHESRTALVNQREIGKNSTSFSRALRAGLREDPDIVLVGELRDLETVGMALETANTGHLVLATLHTTSAIGTIDRIIDMYPPEQHNQMRSVLADVLRGVISQILCRRVGGGRVAAFEILLGSSAVSNTIRQGKTHQIMTIMTTGRARGDRALNDDLEELVRNGIVEPQEAILRTTDRRDMMQRLGVGPGV